MFRKKRAYFTSIFSLLAGFGTYWFFPDFPDAPKAGVYMGITVWGVVSLALEVFELEIISVAVCALYILTGVGTSAQIMAPWTFDAVWLIFSGLLIGHMTISTGLAKRVALTACAKVGGSYIAVLLGLLAAGVLLGPMITSALGKCVVIGAVALGCCQALDLKPMSKAASGVIMAGFVAVDTGRIAFMTGAADNLMILDNYVKALGVGKPAWVDYFFHNFPPSLLYGVCGVFFICIFCKPQKEISAESLKNELLAMPKISVLEVKGTLLLGFLILCFVTEKLHGISIAYISVLVAASMFFPGIRLLSKNEMHKINIWILIFIACCMSLGVAAKVSGVDTIFVAALTPYLEGSSTLAAFKYYLAGVGGNIVLTPLANISTFTVPLAKLAAQMGAPLPFMYAFNHGVMQLLFPYESALLLYFYGTGYVSLRMLLLIQGGRIVINTLLFTFFTLPYWNFIHLF